MEKASLEVSVRESSQMISDFEEAGSTFQTSSNPEKTEPYHLLPLLDIKLPKPAP